MIDEHDMKTIQGFAKTILNKKIGFASIKNSEEWTIFEVKK